MNAIRPSQDFGSLPEKSSSVIRTRDGIALDVESNRWSYRSGAQYVSCNFAALPESTARFMLGLKGVFAWYAANMATSTLHTAFTRVAHLLRHIASEKPGPIDEIDHVDLLNYRAHLGLTKSWYLGNL